MKENSRNHFCRWKGVLRYITLYKIKTTFGYFLIAELFVIATWNFLRNIKFGVKILRKIQYFSSWLQNTEQTAIRYNVLFVGSHHSQNIIKVKTHITSKGLWTSVFSSYVLSHTRRILTRRYEKEKAQYFSCFAKAETSLHLLKYFYCVKNCIAFRNF